MNLELKKKRSGNRELAEKLLDQWCSELPTFPLQSLSQNIKFKEAEEFTIYAAVSEIRKRQRSFEEFSQPYNNESFSNSPIRPNDSMLWDWNRDQEGDFSTIIPEICTRIECIHCHGQGKIQCSTCHGQGKTECPSCHGTGSVTCDRCGGSQKYKCDQCNGTGRMSDGTRCRSCCDGFKVCSCTGGKVRCSKWGCRNGFIKCKKCNGEGFIVCTSCDGQGALLTGFKLVQKDGQELREEIWAEQGVPKSLFSDRSLLTSGGDRILEWTEQGGPVSEFPELLDNKLHPLQETIVRLQERYVRPNQTEQFGDQKISLYEVEFIRYEGEFDLTENGKTETRIFVFWINPKTGWVIDENNFVGTIAKEIIKQAEAANRKGRTIEALRHAINACLVNEEGEDKVRTYYRKLRNIRTLGYITGALVSCIITGIVRAMTTGTSPLLGVFSLIFCWPFFAKIINKDLLFKMNYNNLQFFFACFFCSIPSCWPFTFLFLMLFISFRLFMRKVCLVKGGIIQCQQAEDKSAFWKAVQPSKKTITFWYIYLVVSWMMCIIIEHLS